MAEEEKVTAVVEEATSMADYEKELEASFKKLEEGDMITGTVIAVDEKRSHWIFAITPKESSRFPITAESLVLW